MREDIGSSLHPRSPTLSLSEGLQAEPEVAGRIVALGLQRVSFTGAEPLDEWNPSGEGLIAGDGLPLVEIGGGLKQPPQGSATGKETTGQRAGSTGVGLPATRGPLDAMALWSTAMACYCR